LFRRSPSVVRVNENVRIEEATNGHYLLENESRPG
jgi:hypothetical protein